MDRYRVAIVIPAFNEAATIKDIVCAVKKYGQPIVVNDCSGDDTALEAKLAGALVVSHEKNEGYDGALNSGFKEAARLKYDLIITLDADGQHDPYLLRYFIEKLQSGTPLVLGVRSSMARLSERIFGLYTRMRYGIIDPLCGLKGYHREVYENLGYFDSYNSIGTELMLRAVSSGSKFEQISFAVKERDDLPRIGTLISANKKIICSLVSWINR